MDVQRGIYFLEEIDKNESMKGYVCCGTEEPKRMELQGERRRVGVPNHDPRKSPKIKHRRQEEVTVIQKTFPGPSRLTTCPHPSGRPPGHPRHQLRHWWRRRPRLPEAEMPPEYSCVSGFLVPCPQTFGIPHPPKSP